jgi:hypothetical protein
MQPFYVNRGNRFRFHIKETKNYNSGKKLNIPKIKRISYILVSGREPVIPKMFTGLHKELPEGSYSLLTAPEG